MRTTLILIASLCFCILFAGPEASAGGLGYGKGRVDIGRSGKKSGAAVPNMRVDSRRPWRAVRQNVAAIVSAAPKRAVENVREPVRTVRYDGDRHLIWAPNPDRRTWDVIPIYFRGYGGPNTLPIIDLGSGKLNVQNYPRGLNWHLCPNVLAPNGKVYISTLKGFRVAICVYDPARNELKLDAIRVPEHVRGETHPLVRSTDGMLFAGGGHPSRAASCIMIDPRTHRVTDFGACGPSHAPSGCWNYSMGADDTHVYIASGKVPWYLIAVDRRTKRSTVLAKTANSGGLVSVSQDIHGVKAYVRTGSGAKPRRYWCHRGKLVPKERPCPWSTRRPDWRKALPPKPEVYSQRAVPNPGQKAEFWVKTKVRGVAPDRENPGWTCFRYDVPLYAMGSHRLVEMPDGRVFGTAGAYTGNYIYDPSSRKCTYMGKIPLSHYATVVHDNKIWMSGYPSSPVYVFDCAKPWNVRTLGSGPGAKLAPVDSPGSNPRMLGRLGESGCHKMYGAAAGASGRIYFGGRWIRNGSGGGLGWWDPKTGKGGGLWKPLSNQQVAFMCSAGDGKYIVLSTRSVSDTVLKKPRPGEGVLVVFDDAKKRIVSQITVVKGVSGPGPIAWAGGNRVIGWTSDPSDAGKSILYGVDVVKRQVAWKVPLPFKLPVKIGSNQKEHWDFRLGPDGKIWTFMGKSAKTLVRIDPRTAAIQAVAKVSMGGRLAFSPPDVYLSGTTFLRRIRGVAAGK